MKIRNVLVAALSLSLVAGSALANDTSSLSVSATVQDKCKFQTATTASTLIIAGFDPSSATAVSNTADIIFRCTLGASYTAAVTGGLTGRTLTGSGTAAGQTMAYTLSWNSGSTGSGLGHGAGKDITAVLKAEIAPSAFENVKAGPYAETISVTVNP